MKCADFIQPATSRFAILRLLVQGLFADQTAMTMPSVHRWMSVSKISQLFIMRPGISSVLDQEQIGHTVPCPHSGRADPRRNTIDIQIYRAVAPTAKTPFD